MRQFTLILFVCVLLSGVSIASAQTVCTETVGQTQRHEYVAEDIQTRMYYTVYTPPCYDSTTDRYPVLYLMHGSNDDDNHWIRLGAKDILDVGISSGELPPAIVVFPFGNWIANENRFDGASWDDTFMNQLMPLVENQYRINGTRSARAIGGISRGGFWAFHLAFRYPVMFGSVGGHSAFFDRYHAAPEYNPLDLALNAPGIESMRIALDRGADDYAAPGLDIMDENLAQRGVAYTYTIYPQGQHNNEYWGQHIREYLEFYMSPWMADAQPQVAVTPTAAPELPPASNSNEAGMALYLPVVAFNSMEANISLGQLNSVRGGMVEPKLVLSESVAAELAQYDVPIASAARIIADDALYNTLWRDTSLFSLTPFDQIISRYRVLNVDELHPMDQLETYPFIFETDTPNFYPEHLTRLLMSGVTALTRETIPVLDENGVEWAVSGILPYVQQADFFHTSNEVSFAPDCASLAGFSFCSKEEHFQLFNVLGLDIVELSGNHNNDYGYEAYLNTLQWYRDNDIAVVGGGTNQAEAETPLLINHNGNDIAMIACNWAGPNTAIADADSRPGAAACTHNWLRDTIQTLKADHDMVIVSMQYWEFEQYAPTAQQRADFQAVASYGADVVIGTQAHFPQSVGFYAQDDGAEAFIHYGLGNLFFDQEFFGGVRFFMDQLFIYEGQLLFVDPFTGIIEDQGRPRPMTDEERRNFLFLVLVQNGS